MIEATRDLISRGYRIVPLQGKRPFRRDWPNQPLTLEDTHEENIGVLLTNDQRLTCVDVDVKNGAPGLATLEDWRLLVPDFDREPDQITPSGGMHFLLRVPDGVDMNTLPNGNAAPGIDVLRDRRQFVVAPSFTEQGAYVGSLPATPTDAPLMSRELLEILRVERTTTERSEPDVAPSIERVREAVRRIPNTEATTRDEWVEMALFVKGAVGAENEADGLEIFEEWAAAWPGNSPEENERVYTSGSPKAGWHALVKRAGMEADEALAAFGAVPDEPEEMYDSYTADELQLLPPMRWLIKDLLPERGRSMIFGHSGTGKSFAALHLACCVAGGLPFHGKQVLQGPVAFIAMEGFEDYKRRLPAALADLGLPNSTPVHIIDGNQQGKPRYLLNEPRARAAMIARLKRIKPVLLIIDTIAKAAAGLDENSNSEEAVVQVALDQLLAMGISVNMVHHSGWGGEHARGASARRADVDLELQLLAEGRDIQLKVTKTRSSDSGYDFNGQLVKIGDTLVYRPVSGAQAAFGGRDDMWHLLAMLQQQPKGGVTQTRMKDLLSWGPPKIGRALRQAENERLVQGAERKPYRLTPLGEAELMKWQEREALTPLMEEENEEH